MEFGIGCCCERCDEGRCVPYGDYAVGRVAIVRIWNAQIPDAVLAVSGAIQLVFKTSPHRLSYIIASGVWSKSSLQNSGAIEVQLLDGTPVVGATGLTGAATLVVSGDTGTLTVNGSGTYDGTTLSGQKQWSKSPGFKMLCTNKMPAVDSTVDDACLNPLPGQADCVYCKIGTAAPAYRVTLNIPEIVDGAVFPQPFIDCYQYYNREFIVLATAKCQWSSIEIQRPILQDCFGSGYLRCQVLAGGVNQLPRVQLNAESHKINGIPYLRWRVLWRYALNLCPADGIPVYPINVSHSQFATMGTDFNCASPAVTESGTTIEVLT